MIRFLMIQQLLNELSFKWIDKTKVNKTQNYKTAICSINNAYSASQC